MNKKTKIIFGFKYCISYAFLGLLIILITIIGSLLFKNEELIYMVLFYLFMALCFLFSTLCILYFYQYAIIYNDEIIFKSLLCTFAKINFNSFSEIKRESLITFRNNLGFKACNDWIVFYNSKKQFPKVGLNSKKAPYMIPYNEKNAQIIKSFIDKDTICNF